MLHEAVVVTCFQKRCYLFYDIYFNNKYVLNGLWIVYDVMLHCLILRYVC